MLYDPARLLVARSTTASACRSPHLVADVLTALNEKETATLVKASTPDGKLAATFVVNGTAVEVTQCPDYPWFLVAHGARFVRVNPLRETYVANALPAALAAYAANEGAAPEKEEEEEETVRVAYLEPGSFVDAIRLVLNPPE